MVPLDGGDSVYPGELESTGLWMRLNRPGRPLEQVQVAVLGARYDGSVTHARGAAQAPAELRALSADSWFFTEEGLDLRGLAVRDLGDAPVRQGGPEATQRALAAAVRPLVQAGAIPLVLGGDHSVSSGVVAGIAGSQPLGVLYDLIHALARPPQGREPLRLAGFDVVEIAPPLDHNRITAWAGVRIVTEMCGYLRRTCSLPF